MRKLLTTIAGCLILFLLPCSLLAQDRAVTGRITDAKGAPIQGVSVVVKQTNTGTTTDADGKFRLNVPANGVLVISSTGYKSQSLKPDAGSADIQIKMEDDIARLDEVVVTGLTTNVKRRNLANSVATISAKQLDGVAPAQTFDQALNGKIPGAYINSNTGAPGGGLSVKLRGVTSIYGNTQPLYVVDGVFMDNTATSAGLNAVTSAAAGGNASTQDNPSSRIADLRAEDIENIEILKGRFSGCNLWFESGGWCYHHYNKARRRGKTKVSFSQDLGVTTVR
jgi:hypothetical protein